MTDSKDPLSSLVSSDAKATDRKQLAELLASYLVIDEESKEFTFLPAFAEIKGNDAKVELVFAGVKARALYFNLPDGLAPAEVISMDILPEGSIKTSLKRLLETRKLKKDKEGHYYLPAQRLPDLVKSFTA